MAIGNCGFHPSLIEDRIYDILDSDPDYLYSTEVYWQISQEKIIEYLNVTGVQWSMIADAWQNMEGESTSICWIEDGHLHHIVLQFKY
jgi:hypothetical protein